MGTNTVFVSYSRKDSEFADRLKADLRAAGIEIWIDHESLQPGASDWQDAVRRGIEASHALIYIGSPDAAASPNVRSEVVIARTIHHHIYPLMARGDEWATSAPFELIPADFFDARGDAYQAALVRLKDALGQKSAPTPAPKAAPASAAQKSTMIEQCKMDAGCAVNKLSWSPNGVHLASGGRLTGRIHIWDSRSGSLVSVLVGQGYSSISSIAYSSDGRLLASAGLSIMSAVLTGIVVDRTLQLWAPSTGGLVHVFEKTHNANALAWSPDSSKLAACAGFHQVWTFDAKTHGRLKCMYIGPHSTFARSVYDIAWSPDGSRLAIGGYYTRIDAPIRVWDPHTGVAILDCVGHTASVTGVSWSADGVRLASVSEDATLRIWDVTAKCLLKTAAAHTGPARTVAWSPNGKYIATGGDDNIVRIWDPTNTVAIAALKGHTAKVKSVVWSPDSKLLASGADDKTIRIWKITQ